MKKLILSAAFLAIGTFAMAQQEKRMEKMDPAQI
jgi:protein CpxP